MNSEVPPVIITIEDIVEEIFGEIEDEHDSSDLLEKQLEKNRYLLWGRLEIDYLNEKYLLAIPASEEYDTLAGYIIYNYESIPEKNSTVYIDNLPDYHYKGEFKAHRGGGSKGALLLETNFS